MGEQVELVERVSNRMSLSLRRKGVNLSLINKHL